MVLFPTASTSSLWHSLAFLLAVRLFWHRHTVLVESQSHIHSGQRLTYNWVSIALCVTTVEFTVLYFSVYVLHILILCYHLNVRGKNSCHDSIPNARIFYHWFNFVFSFYVTVTLEAFSLLVWGKNISYSFFQCFYILKSTANHKTHK